MTQEDDNSDSPTKGDPEYRRWGYSFEEFEHHLDSLDSRRMEKTTGPETEGAFIRNVLRVNRYFSEFYDEDEASYKTSTFLVAITHLTKHQEDYDTERFGVKCDDGSLLVSEALQRAVHWYFTERDRDEWGPDASIVIAVKEWARQWIQNKGQQDAARNRA